MRKLWLVIAALGIMLSSCGATIRVTGTAPNMDNDGTCVAPQLFSMSLPNNYLKMHFQWTGPVSGEDSMAVTPGVPFSFTRTVSHGVYTIRAWASDLGGVGCDTTITVVTKSKPAKPSAISGS